MLALAAIALGGCVTTQRRSERLAVRAQRTLAARNAVRVRHPGTALRVARVAVVRARRGGAIVVELVNRTARAVADVPITVGIGHRALNARAGLGYFAAHVAAVGAGRRATWVLTTRKRLPPGRPFALAGDAVRSPASLPAIAVALSNRGALVHNPTGVPQFGLPVYAFARRGGRYVAAGRAALDLDAGRSATVPIHLVGAARGATIDLEALPTIYR